MKKAQGISINVIIVAAIALIVLVVLVAIFTGRLGMFTKVLGGCAERDGVCVSYNKAVISAGETCAARTDGRAVSLPGTDCKTASGSDSATCCIKT